MSIVVISFRRSGTHLALNLLGHNINKKYIFKNIVSTKNKTQLDKSKCYLIKSHFDFPDFNIKLFNDTCGIPCYFESINKIFVCRNPINLMSSLYCYTKRYEKQFKTPFRDFVKQNLEKWIQFMNNFVSNREKYNLMTVTFNEIINTPEKVLNEISNRFGLLINKQMVTTKDKTFDSFAKPIHKKITPDGVMNDSIRKYIVDECNSSLLKDVIIYLKTTHSSEFSFLSCK